MIDKNRMEFFAALDARLDVGEREYKGRSFSKDPTELLEELAQESLDLAGWGYILWTRLRAMQAALKK